MKKLGRLMRYTIVRYAHDTIHCNTCSYESDEHYHVTFRYCPRCQQFLDKKLKPELKDGDIKTFPTDDSAGSMRATYKLGCEYQSKGLFDLAILAFTELILKDPCPVTHLARGRARAFKGDYEKAIKDLTFGIEHSQDVDIKSLKAHVVYERGRTYQMAAQHEKAIEDFETCLIIGGRKAHYLRYCAKSLLALGQNDKALANLEEAIVVRDVLALLFYSN